MVKNNFFDSKVINNWMHIINSKEEYQKFWDAIYKFRELCLGHYIIIKGSFSCKDERVFSNEEELITGIRTYTYKKETMEKVFELKIGDPLVTVLFSDLATKEIITTEKGAINQKKAKSCKGLIEFENYLKKFIIKILKGKNRVKYYFDFIKKIFQSLGNLFLTRTFQRPKCTTLSDHSSCTFYCLYINEF